MLSLGRVIYAEPAANHVVFNRRDAAISAGGGAMVFRPSGAMSGRHLPLAIGKVR